MLFSGCVLNCNEIHYIRHSLTVILHKQFPIDSVKATGIPAVNTLI